MCTSSGGSRSSLRLPTHSRTAREAPTETPVVRSVYQSLPRNTNTVSLTASPPCDGGSFLLRACGLRISCSPIPCVGLSGLVPRLDRVVSGGLLCTSPDFREFHAHGPRMRVEDLSAFSGRSVAHVPATVTAVDHRPGRGAICLPPSPPSIAVPAAGQCFLQSTLLWLRFFAHPLRAARALQKSLLPRWLSPSMLLPRALHREPTPPRSLLRPRPPFRRLATKCLRIPCHLRAAPRGAGEHPLPQALRLLLLIMVSGPAMPLDYPPSVLTRCRELHGCDRLRVSLCPLLLPPRLSRWHSSRPTATAPSLSELLC